MRMTPSGLDTAVSHVVLGSSIVVVILTMYGAFFWESFSLAAGASYQLAIMTLNSGNLEGERSKMGKAAQSAVVRFAVVSVLVLLTPFLAGGAVHALNHASTLVPLELLPGALCAFLVGVLRGFYYRYSSAQKGAIVLVNAALAALPFIAPLLTVLAIAAGFHNADGIVGVGLMVIMIFAVLAPQVVQLSRLLD